MVKLRVEAVAKQRAENARVVQEAVNRRCDEIERAAERGVQLVDTPFFSADECKQLQATVGAASLMLFVLDMWCVARDELGRLGNLGLGIELVNRPVDAYIKLIPKPSVPD